MIRTPLRRQRKVKDSEKGVAFVVLDGGREVCTKSNAGRVAYYRRTYDMEVRQNEICPLCKRMFYTECGIPTFDHQDGRTAGRKDERLLMEDGVTWRNAALCGECNCKKGSVRYAWTASNQEYKPVKKAL
jgi:hypothetical protein